MKKIFFDFDGTLVDFSDRLYWLHQDLMSKYQLKPFSQEKYLMLKRKRIPEKEVLGRLISDNKLIKKIAEERLVLIENPKYLQYNRLFPGVEKTLQALSQKFKLFIVTNRKSEKNFKKELSRFKIDSYFQAAAISSIGEGQAFEKKAKMIKKWNPVKKDLVVGDSEDDILAGRCLGLTTVAVLTGIRARSFLEKLNPDHIVDNIGLLYHLVK